MNKFIAFVFVFFVSYLAAPRLLASPGDDLLLAKLPSQYRQSTKVTQEPLVKATEDAVRGNRSLAPQIVAAAERRAEDCPAAEAVVRAALRQLQPNPTAIEVYAVTRAAVANAPHRETTGTNAEGEKVASGTCSESIITAAAAEYPQFASILNDSGKQLAIKGYEPGIGAEPETTAPVEQGIGSLPGVVGEPIIPPGVTFPSGPNGSLVNPVTQTVPSIRR